MKRPLTSTELTDAEEAGIEPLAAELSWPGNGGQMCIGDAGLGGLAVPGQEGFLSAVGAMTGGLEAHTGFPDTAMDPGTLPWRKLPTCHGPPLTLSKQALLTHAQPSSSPSLRPRPRPRLSPTHPPVPRLDPPARPLLPSARSSASVSARRYQRSVHYLP